MSVSLLPSSASEQVRHQLFLQQRCWFETLVCHQVSLAMDSASNDTGALLKHSPKIGSPQAPQDREIHSLKPFEAFCLLYSGTGSSLRCPFSLLAFGQNLTCLLDLLLPILVRYKLHRCKPLHESLYCVRFAHLREFLHYSKSIGKDILNPFLGFPAALEVMMFWLRCETREMSRIAGPVKLYQNVTVEKLEAFGGVAAEIHRRYLRETDRWIRRRPDGVDQTRQATQNGAAQSSVITQLVGSCWIYLL